MRSPARWGALLFMPGVAAHGFSSTCAVQAPDTADRIRVAYSGSAEYPLMTAGAARGLALRMGALCGDVLKALNAS